MWGPGSETFRIPGSEFRVPGSKFRFPGPEFRVPGSETFRVPGHVLGCAPAARKTRRLAAFGLRGKGLSGLGFRVLEFRVQGLGFRGFQGLGFSYGSGATSRSKNSSTSRRSAFSNPGEFMYELPSTLESSARRTARYTSDVTSILAASASCSRARAL